MTTASVWWSCDHSQRVMVMCPESPHVQHVLEFLCPLFLQNKDLRIIIALFTPHTSLARTVWCQVGGEANKLDKT